MLFEKVLSEEKLSRWYGNRKSKRVLQGMWWQVDVLNLAEMGAEQHWNELVQGVEKKLVEEEELEMLRKENMKEKETLEKEEWMKERRDLKKELEGMKRRMKEMERLQKDGKVLSSRTVVERKTKKGGNSDEGEKEK